MKKNKFVLTSLLIMGALAFLSCKMEVAETITVNIKATETQKEGVITTFYDGFSPAIRGRCSMSYNNKVELFLSHDSNFFYMTEAPIPKEYISIIKNKGYNNNFVSDGAVMYILNKDKPAKEITVTTTTSSHFPTKITGADYILLPSMMGAYNGYDLFGDELISYGYYHLSSSDEEYNMDPKNFPNLNINPQLPEELSSYKDIFDVFMTDKFGLLTNIYERDFETEKPCILFEYLDLDYTFKTNLLKSLDTSGSLHYGYIMQKTYPMCEYLEVDYNEETKEYDLRLGENIKSVNDLTNGNVSLKRQPFSKEEFDALFIK